MCAKDENKKQNNNEYKYSFFKILITVSSTMIFLLGIAAFVLFWITLELTSDESTNNYGIVCSAAIVCMCLICVTIIITIGIIKLSETTIGLNKDRNLELDSEIIRTLTNESKTDSKSNNS